MALHRSTSLFVLFLTACFLQPANAQITGQQPPPLHVTDWILGDENDVGAWGDGQVYVLDLWGTWCSPCIKNIPHLTELQTQYRDRGLVVIGYSWEDPETLRSFVATMGDKMQYIVVGDTTETMLGALNEREAIQGFPYAYLVDASGVVVWEGHPEDNDLTGAVARLFER